MPCRVDGARICQSGIGKINNATIQTAHSSAQLRIVLEVCFGEFDPCDITRAINHLLAIEHK